MKSLLTQEFEAARIALLDAAIAIDAHRIDDARSQLRSLIAICSVILDLLDDDADSPSSLKTYE